MTTTTVFCFSPVEATETDNTVAGGAAKVLNDFTTGKTVEGITSYVNLGNVYVVVTTA